VDADVRQPDGDDPGHAGHHHRAGRQRQRGPVERPDPGEHDHHAADDPDDPDGGADVSAQYAGPGDDHVEAGHHVAEADDDPAEAPDLDDDLAEAVAVEHADHFADEHAGDALADADHDHPDADADADQDHPDADSDAHSGSDADLSDDDADHDPDGHPDPGPVRDDPAG
jgi:hypothetical protein